MVAIINFLITAALISCARSTSSSSNATHPISTATAIIDTTTPYFIELLGYKTNFPTEDEGWGAVIEDPNLINDTGLVSPMIGDPFTEVPSFNFTLCNQFSQEIQHVSTNSDPNPLPLIPPSDSSLLLALGRPLQESSNSSNCASFKEIETVPFALNIGLKGAFNGSLVLGGWYDTSRIASTAWHLVPESVGNSSFLKTGKLDVAIIVDSQPYNAMLSYGTFLNFPNTVKGACTKDSLVISFPGENGQENLDIPIDLRFRNSGMCGTFDVGSIELGMPFFQATYMYVDKNGQVYLTAATELDSLPISMAPFDANATLKLPSGVTAYTASSATLKATSLLPYGTGWNMVFLGLFVAWIAS